MVRDIGGHHLAGGAVAAGGGEDQLALLVAQRAGQAVDLRLGGERHLVVRREVEEAAHPADELAHFLLGEGVVEAEHRQRVADLGEMRGRRRADLPRRAVLADQMRELRFQRGIAPHQRVIVGVGNLGRVLAMVEPVVARDLGGEALQLGRASASVSSASPCKHGEGTT